jgi:hypothetical protein
MILLKPDTSPSVRSAPIVAAEAGGPLENGCEVTATRCRPGAHDHAATSVAAAVSGAWGHHGHHGHNPVQAVSSLLGMDPDDVISELKSGKSLDDIASEHGVSHQDLVNALVAGMPERMRTSDRATQIAEKIATRKGLQDGILFDTSV